MPSPAGGNGRRRRNGSKHDKTGCLTCRHRRKKCLENTFPVCGACTRLNLECVREPLRSIVRRPCSNAKPKEPEMSSSRRSPSGRNLPEDDPSNKIGIVDIQPQWHPPYPGRDVERTKRRYIMAYYITVLAELLTTSKEHNSFLSAFVPMAMESPALYEALIAWSAGHMSTTEASFKVTAIEARSRALSALATSVSQQQIAIHSHETNSAACLVLLTSEVCLGNCADWYHHLVGAKQIIMSARVSDNTGKTAICGPEALKTSQEGQWVLRNFAYHDILGSVTMGTEPLMKENYFEDITVGVDTYLGIASGLLSLISRINCLQSLPGGPDAWASLKEECLGIECQLKQWQYGPNSNSSLAALAEAFRSSTLIHLYRQMRRFVQRGISLQFPLSTLEGDQIDIISAKIRQEVTNTVESVSKIPIHDLPETALLFPLFLAGGEASARADVDAICTRLTLMLEKRHFANIKQALEVLEEVWSERFNGAGLISDISWEDVLSRRNGKLLLT